MKKLNSSFRRRIATVVLLAGITGTFLSVYYFVYLPKQRGQFNAQTFRALNNITVNFTERLVNAGVVKLYAHISEDNKDPAFNENYREKGKISNTDSAFLASFTGYSEDKNNFSVATEVHSDTIIFIIKEKQGIHKDSITREVKLLSELLDPLTISHSNTFNAIYLIDQEMDSIVGDKRKVNPDTILYKPQMSELNIANINVDSLFPDMNFQVPQISNVKIDDISFKLFMLPFRIPSVNEGTYIMAALMDSEYYNAHVQDIPVVMLVSVLLLIILVMLILPFLKIYLLNANESLKISDIRSIIAVVFILPFLLVLIYSIIWIYNEQDNYTDEELGSLHNRITTSFFKEINYSIGQQKVFDRLMNAPKDSLFQIFRWDTDDDRDADFKDAFFHPKLYRNFTNLHWMDYKGDDLAVWNLTKPTSTYFNVKNRAYFTDIKYSRLKFLPDYIEHSDNGGFSIQPILSRLTGEYTISIATGSKTRIKDKNSIAMAISSKMYSVYNPVLPAGYGFCIIDSSGLMLASSDTSKNLQENIFRESTNNYMLRNAVSHKDSVMLKNIFLHEQKVKMLVSPLQGLPYYLITFHHQRRQVLFIFHIAGFVFVSQVLLLLLASVFSYFILLSKKRIGKLSFEPSKLNWLKPTPAKKNYYIKNSIQLGICLLLILVFSLFYSGDQFCLYWLNISMLLPLFVITGYYLIRNAKTFADKKMISEDLLTTESFMRYLRSSKNVLILYFLFIIFYTLIKDDLFFHSDYDTGSGVKWGIWILTFIMPVHAAIVAGTPVKLNFKAGYLNYFIFSLLVAVLLVSIIPVIALVNFGFREEKKLQLQSAQIELAKKIQQRRAKINPLGWTTKLDTLNVEDKQFIRDMKFDKFHGVYLGSRDTLLLDTVYYPMESSLLSCSPFYQVITQALFLPPDHDDFYSKTAHKNYYHWQSSTDSNSLTLTFNNTSDYRDRSSIKIRTTPVDFYLFKEFAGTKEGLLLLFFCVVLLVCFYKIIYSTTTRIFLLNYFKPGNAFLRDDSGDAEWLKHQYNSFSHDKLKLIMSLDPDVPFSFEELRKKEREFMVKDERVEEFIIQMHLALLPVFERIWKSLTDSEKFTLYDFAADGFTNYKKMLVLYELFNKGLLVTEEERTGINSGNLTFMSLSFRNFLLTKENTAEIKKQTVENKMSSWGTVRLVFIMILIAFAVFLLITQQEATQRIVTIITTLGTLLPLMLKLFDSSSASAAAKKQ